MKRGILYIANADFIKESIKSATQLCEVMTDIHISVVTNVNVEKPCFDNVIKCTKPRFGWGDKPDNIHLSPYDKTIYFDTDTYVVSDISEIFDILNNYDMALAQAPERVSHQIEGIPQCFPEYNTGVIAFNNNRRVNEVLNQWKEIYENRQENEDQPAFRKAVFENDVKVTVLPNEYNCRWPLAGNVSGRVKIFHGRLEEFDKNITGFPGKLKIEDVIKKINSTTRCRVFVNRKDDLEVYVADK